ncbi:MAG: hypothetical protein R3C68_09390 [Myxococcota bacterium]
MPIGIIGGGDYKPEAVTVTTYDSAYLHMENLGANYGLVIFDECHHLPSEAYAGSPGVFGTLSPGLSATPERSDGSHSALDELIGPIVHRVEIGALAGEYLAEYETRRVIVELTAASAKNMTQSEQDYRDFVPTNGIRMSHAQGWGSL